MASSGCLHDDPTPAMDSGPAFRERFFPEIPRLAAEEARRLAVAILFGLIRAYQLTLSPFIGGQCRFHPTCSNYALEVIDRHGPMTGSWLALRRLLKCHPFHPGGLDPPPGRKG